jgi:hypothetical protein
MTGWTVEARLSPRVVRARRGLEPPVALKATPPGSSWSDRARLRREGRLLDRARGPGVVELLDILEADRRTALVLAYVPLHHPAAGPDDLRPTVDRLTGLGIVHHALRPDHLLMTADGDLVLCGFGSAERLRRPSGGGRPRSPGGRPGGRRRP